MPAGAGKAPRRRRKRKEEEAGGLESLWNKLKGVAGSSGCLPLTHLQFNDCKQVTPAESERAFVNQHSVHRGGRNGERLTAGRHMQERGDAEKPNFGEFPVFVTGNPTQTTERGRRAEAETFAQTFVCCY